MRKATTITQDEFNQIFSDIWLELNRQDPELFPAEEIIRDSALFKASPFHQLSDDQIAAEESIMDALSEALAGSGDSADSGLSRLIFVQGVAGTGKTVFTKSPVLSHSNRNGYQWASQ